MINRSMKRDSSTHAFLSGARNVSSSRGSTSESGYSFVWFLEQSLRIFMFVLFVSSAKQLYLSCNSVATEARMPNIRLTFPSFA